MPADKDLLTVRDAARSAAVTQAMVRWWIEAGKLPAQHDATGLLVSRAALQALVKREMQPATSEPSAGGAPTLPPGQDGFVPPFVAARLTGVPSATISNWGRTGRVASKPGAHGRLVRLTDVQALAAQTQGRR